MERFYHIRARHSGLGEVRTNGGATVRLVSADVPMYVDMQVSHCNPSDVFSKKLGRLYCVGAESVERRRVVNGDQVIDRVAAIQPAATKRVHIRDLPGEFRRLFKHVHRKAHEPIHADLWEEYPRYEHMVRDWLPSSEVTWVLHDILDPGPAAPQAAVVIEQDVTAPAQLYGGFIQQPVTLG